MYMAAKLARYPDELALLTESLRRGIPEQILQHAGTDEYEAELARLGAEFAKARGIDRSVAAETVTAWVIALNRPVGYQPAPVPDRVYPDSFDPSREKTAKILMTLIVGLGGFLGCALGTLFMIGVNVYLVGVDVELFDKKVTERINIGENITSRAAITAVILVRMGIAGSLGGVVAVLGWLWGRGDTKPWAGFAAAFGSGFGMSALTLSYFRFAVLFRLAIVAVSVFGATFTTAARGGIR
jgi:hypothetical protein